MPNNEQDWLQLNDDKCWICSEVFVMTRMWNDPSVVLNIRQTMIGREWGCKISFFAKCDRSFCFVKVTLHHWLSSLFCCFRHAFFVLLHLTWHATIELLETLFYLQMSASLPTLQLHDMSFQSLNIAQARSFATISCMLVNMQQKVQMLSRSLLILHSIFCCCFVQANWH